MVIIILSEDEVVCFELLVLPLDPLFIQGVVMGSNHPFTHARFLP